MRVEIPVWLRPDGANSRSRFILIGVTSVLAVWLGFATFTPAQTILILRHAGYPVMAVTFGFWIWAVWRLRPAQADVGVWAGGEGRFVLSWAVGLSLFAALTSPFFYRVLYDEVVIQSTGTIMHWHREVGSIGRAYNYDGILQLFQPYLDKRPYFFPFLVSLLHDLTGWREANAFALNIALMPVMLVLAYFGGKSFAGHRAGLVAMISLGVFPLVILNATAAGLEMLNLTLVLGLIVSGTTYLHKPDGMRLDLLVLTSILLANTRYESSIYVASTAVIVLMGWVRAGRPVLSAGAIMAPLLLIPYALHNRYLAATPVLWELREGLEHRFSLDYLAANIGYARVFFFNLGPAIANSPWLTYAGIAALGGFSFIAWRRRLRWSDLSPAVQVYLAVALGVGVNLALLLAYYWGDLSDPIVSRLSLPLHALVALAIGAGIAMLERAKGWRLVGPVTAVILICYGLWGGAMTRRLPDLNLVETTQRWELSVIDRLPAAERLILTDKSPLFWFAQGMGSTSCDRARQRAEGLAYHWRARSFQEILVTQRYAPIGADGGWVLEPASRLPEGVILEPLAQHRFGVKLQCVSRVIDVKAPPVSTKEKTSDVSTSGAASSTSTYSTHVASGL